MRATFTMFLIFAAADVSGEVILVDFESQSIGDRAVGGFFYDEGSSDIATTLLDALANFDTSTWIYSAVHEQFRLPATHRTKITTGITSSRSLCAEELFDTDCEGHFAVSRLAVGEPVDTPPFTDFRVDVAADDSTNPIQVKILYTPVTPDGREFWSALGHVSLDGAIFTASTVVIADLDFVDELTGVPVVITNNTPIFGVQFRASDDPAGLLFDNVRYVLPEVDDGDGDGVPDTEDNCPTDSNPDQADLDEDGVGDVCDEDADGDGELPPLDCNDLDPGIFTTAIEICTDGIDNDCDLLVDAADDGADCDGDTIPNAFENWPDEANPGQADLDNDRLGDVCDPDDDNDGYEDDMDNCPTVANDQADFDLDGVGDACDSDNDGDGVENTGDLCLATTPSDSDAGVPGRRLGKNRWADVDGDGLFDTSGKNPTGRYYTIDDTSGCNCAQIIEACGYGQGHTEFGCSNSVMDWWTGRFDRDGQPAYQCEN